MVRASSSTPLTVILKHPEPANEITLAHVMKRPGMASAGLVAPTPFPLRGAHSTLPIAWPAGFQRFRRTLNANFAVRYTSSLWLLPPIRPRMAAYPDSNKRPPMTIQLSDITLIPYRQITGALSVVLEKGASHCREQGIDPDSLVDFSLYPDMRPFSFQIHSIAHHSLNALKGIEAGTFGPPTDLPQLDYPGLQRLVADTRSALDSFTPDRINALAGGEVLFTAGGGKLKLPFTTENFILTFSLPNLYFHATTAYDILRHKGVPVGKLDYLGEMKLKT